MGAPLKRLSLQSVRGRIQDFIVRHAHLLGDDVMECGSRLPERECWWTDNRQFATGQWTGVDMQLGVNVDVMADLEQLPDEWNERFSGVLCSEVLEHVRQPARALLELRRVMQPGGYAVFTTLTAFPIHAFPDDYRRWTEAGLRVELEMAGFIDVKTEAAGSVEFCLNDHDEPDDTKLSCPIHVFATARKPVA